MQRDIRVFAQKIKKKYKKHNIEAQDKANLWCIEKGVLTNNF